MLTPSGDLLLSPRDAAVIKRALAEGIGVLERRNGGVPVEVVRLLGEISEVAVRFRPRRSRLDGGSGTDPVPLRGNPASSGRSESEWLTVAQAAAKAGFSESYTRRLCRQRTVIARLSARGAWQLDTEQFAAWLDGQVRS